MCNFNKQNDETKAFLHLFMEKASQKVGGVNFLLLLVEAMKAKKPNAMIYNECKISSNHTTIRWNKIIFKDKFLLLDSVLQTHKSSEGTDFNLLSGLNDKTRKKVINLSRTLAPIEFIVTPQNHNDGEGFSFKVFQEIGDDCIKLNPVFLAMFFCSTEFIKKALKYEV